MANVTNHKQSLVDLSPLQINSKNSISHMLYLGRCNVINDDSSIHLVAPTNIHVMPKGCFPIKEITCGRGFACNYGKHFGHICATYTNDMYFLIYGCLQGHMKCLLSLSIFYEAIGSPNMWCLFVCWFVAWLTNYECSLTYFLSHNCFFGRCEGWKV